MVRFSYDRLKCCDVTKAHLYRSRSISMDSLFMSESLKSSRYEAAMSGCISVLSGPGGGGGLEYAAIN